MQCSQCKTDSAHRSHRAGLKERLASLFGYYPYRCHRCGHRFLKLRYADDEPATAAARGTEREIASTRGALRWKAVRRQILLYGWALVLFAIILYYLTREPSIGG
jgi:DNA-directed RNA polymerase subunit RPC12/RpoP